MWWLPVGSARSPLGPPPAYYTHPRVRGQVVNQRITAAGPWKRGRLSKVAVFFSLR